jgi:hypothetical protein
MGDMKCNINLTKLQQDGKHRIAPYPRVNHERTENHMRCIANGESHSMVVVAVVYGRSFG